MALPRNLQSALYKYAAGAKSPASAGAPATPSAPTLAAAPARSMFDRPGNGDAQARKWMYDSVFGSGGGKPATPSAPNPDVKMPYDIQGFGGGGGKPQSSPLSMLGGGPSIGAGPKPVGNNVIFSNQNVAQAQAQLRGPRSVGVSGAPVSPTPAATSSLPQHPTSTWGGYLTHRDGLRKDVGDYFTHSLPETWAPGSEAYQSADARYKNLPTDRALLGGSRLSAGTAAASATALGAAAVLPAAAAVGVPGSAALSAATGAPAAVTAGGVAASLAPTAVGYASGATATPAQTTPATAPSAQSGQQGAPAAQPQLRGPRNTPAAVKPAAMDLKAQDALAAEIKDLPPEQQQAKVQEGVQAHVAALPPEEQQGLQDVATGNVDTPAAKQFNEKVEGPVKDQYVKDEYAKQTANNPNTSPQQAGGILNSIMDGWNNMPNEMKWMMGIGLGGGLLGIMSSMFGGGGGGMGMLGLLGLGAAGLAGAAGGMFGQGAQDMMGGMVGQLGQATGMIPKDMDLSALKGDDAVQRATDASSGGGYLGALQSWWDPKGTAEKVKGQLGQADQLSRLMMVPEGMRPGLLRQISPNSSPEEIQQMLSNANQMHGAMNDSKSQLGQNVQRGREFVADPSKYVNNAASEYINPANWDVMPWNWGGKSGSARGYALARQWAKEAEDKDIKEWVSKYRARGKGGRWVNTQRSSRMTKRVACAN